ncbi:MAG: NTP transferase domain-containing protein [Salinivirgaceae bacterium]|jgi:molybdenum cofactor cytidylyltransferase
MNTCFTELGIVILAAGNSERMGMPKALLKSKSDQYFFEALISSYKATGINTIVLVVQNSVKKTLEKHIQKLTGNIYIAENNEPEKGRMHSLQLGLKLMENKAVFVHNIDNPFVSNGLLMQMITKLEPNTYVKPLYKNKGGHPVLLSAEVANELLQADITKENNLKNALKKHVQIIIETNEPEILLNLNTPDDYQSFIDTH